MIKIMKKEFSKDWNKSVQPRKQRKYLLNAPYHIRAKIMTCNLSKELRKKYDTRSMRVRKGDVVKVMRGGFRGVKSEVRSVNRKDYTLILQGVTKERKDGSKVDFPIHYSNVQIVEVNDSDKRRFKKSEEKVK